MSQVILHHYKDFKNRPKEYSFSNASGWLASHLLILSDYAIKNNLANSDNPQFFSRGSLERGGTMKIIRDLSKPNNPTGVRSRIMFDDEKRFELYCTFMQAENIERYKKIVLGILAHDFTLVLDEDRKEVRDSLRKIVPYLTDIWESVLSENSPFYSDTKAPIENFVNISDKLSDIDNGPVIITTSYVDFSSNNLKKHKLDDLLRKVPRFHQFLDISTSLSL